jgi:tol-pal system protein YbgF
MKLRAILLLSLCLVAGVAHAGIFDDEQARQAIANLRDQVEANQKATEARLTRLEAMAQNRTFDFAKQLDEFKQELADLRGQIEVQGHQLDTLDRRQKELYTDLDTRLRKLEASATAQQQPAANTPDLVAEGKAYAAALNQLKLGNYQAAVAGFQSFLATYPNSKQVSSAQYWIGNAYYELHDYKMAITAQQKVLASWPDSEKAPDALFNIASCQAEMGATRKARETLHTLLKKYPDTPAAEQAKERLAGKR